MKSKNEQLKRELDNGGEHKAEANKNVRRDTTEEATTQRAQHQESTVTSNNSTPRPQTGGILGVFQWFNKVCQEEKKKKKSARRLALCIQRTAMYIIIASKPSQRHPILPRRHARQQSSYCSHNRSNNWLSTRRALSHQLSDAPPAVKPTEENPS